MRRERYGVTVTVTVTVTGTVTMTVTMTVVEEERQEEESTLHSDRRRTTRSPHANPQLLDGSSRFESNLCSPLLFQHHQDNGILR